MKEEATWVIILVAGILMFFLTLMNKYFKDD